MALVQVEETELLQSRQIAEALTKIAAKPEARRKMLEARKLAEPNVAIPELDAAAPVNEALAEIRKELAEERAALKKQREEEAEQRKIAEFRDRWNGQKSQLRSSGWTDDGIAEVEKHAQERGIADLEIAAAHYEKLHPPAEPVTPNGSGSWGFFGEQQAEDDTFVKSMVESRGLDEGALNKEIGLAIREARGTTRR